MSGHGTLLVCEVGPSPKGWYEAESRGHPVRVGTGSRGDERADLAPHPTPLKLAPMSRVYGPYSLIHGNMRQE